MALRITTQEEPVTLMEPAASGAPKPVPGCQICASRMKTWKETTRPSSPMYDLSHALDCAIEIGRHPHDWRYDSRGQRVPR